MRKAIRDSWNNYMSRRRLENLWIEFQTKQAMGPSAQNDEALAHFQQCFLKMVNQSKNEPQIKIGDAAKTNKLSLPESELDFFAQKDQFIPIVCAYLQDSKSRSSQEWKQWQTSERYLVDTLQCIQVFLKDQINQKVDMKQSYKDVMSMIKFQLGNIDEGSAIIKLVKLLNLIFLYDEAQIVVFANQEGFYAILNLIKLQDKVVTETALKYMFKWLHVVVGEEIDEDSDDPERLQSKGEYTKILKQGYIQGIFRQLTDKLSLNDHGNDSFDECEKNAFEEAKDGSQRSRSRIESQASSNSDKSQLMSSSSYQNSEMKMTPGSQARKYLRAGQFLKEVAEMIATCPEANLIDYAQILKILNVFAAINYQVAQEFGVFTAIQERFRAGGTHLNVVFKLFMSIVKEQGKTKVKNQQFLLLIITIIETMFQGLEQGNSDHEDLLVECLNKLKMVLQQKSSKLSIIFLQEENQIRVRSLIFQATAYKASTLGPLLDLTIILMHNMQEESKSDTFAITISELLLKQQMQRTIGPEQGRQLFHFLRIILKEKNVQLTALKFGEGIGKQFEELYDVESRIDQIIDHQIRKFLKQTFVLYFNFNLDPEWNKESQMLLLCTLDLQEKVNSVLKQHSIPPMLSLFKENEDDTEMEEVNFFQTIQKLLNQRESSQFQDIFNGYLAAKLTIALQDTSFLSFQDIKKIIGGLFESQQEINQSSKAYPSRTNPFIATIFSIKINCQAPQLQDKLIVEQSEFLQKIAQKLSEAVLNGNQKQIINYFHNLVLLSQNSRKYKEVIDKILDFKEIVRQLEIRKFDVDVQLFIVQCLLEMQAETIIYENSIMSFEAILMHQHTLTRQEEDFEEFRSLLKEVNQIETLMEHDQRQGKPSLTFESFSDTSKKSSLLSNELQVQDRLENQSKVLNGTLRSNQLGFTLFFITLTQANFEVRDQVIEDLCALAELSLLNVRVMVQQNTEFFLLQLYKIESETGFIPKLGASPNKFIVSLLQMLISYGICVPSQSQNKELLVECFGTRAKLNNMIVDSVTECLSTNFPQISKYVHFLDTSIDNGYNALQINGGAIGVSSWLLTPEISPETLNGVLINLNIGRSLKLTIEILIDYNLMNTDSENEEEQDFNPEFFFIKASLIKVESEQKTEKTLEHLVPLKDMIKHSVFHMQGFNHYVAQLNSGLDLFVNSHQITQGLFQDELSHQSMILKSLDFVPKTTVANLSLIHQPLIDIEPIEKLRNGDFRLNQNELMGLSQVQKVQQSNFYFKIQNPDETLNENDDNLFTLHIPKYSSEIKYKLMRISLEQRSIEIPMLSNIAQIEIFEDSESIMTLKRYLSTEHAINSILELLEYATDDQSTLKCLRLLASIIIQNKSSQVEAADQDLLALFEKINGYDRLKDLLAHKMLEMQHLQVKRIFAQLIEIACDELGCSSRIDEKVSMQTGIRQPNIFGSKIKFMQMGLDLIKSAPVNQSIQFLEMVQILLKVDANMQVFRQHIGFNSILSLFRLIEQNYRFLSLYDITLALFELFISGIAQSDINSLSEEDSQELSQKKRTDIFADGELLRLIFDFLLSRDLERRLRFIKVSQQLSNKSDDMANFHYVASYQNLLLSSQKQNEQVSRVIIDCLSIISIHILTEVSELSQKTESVLLNKILGTIDLFNFILTLLQSQQGGLSSRLLCIICLQEFQSSQATNSFSQPKEDPMDEVQEYALKFLQMLLYLSEDFKKNFEMKGGYQTLIDFIITRRSPDILNDTPMFYLDELEDMESELIKKVPYLITGKSQEAQTNYSKSQYNLNMVMLDAATQKFDNVYAMSPEKQTLVHTVMNRSIIAEQIVAQVKNTLKRPKKVKVIYFGMIQTFLKSLAQLENDVSRQICLKHLHQLMIENEENLNALFSDKNTLKQFIEGMFQYELDVTRPKDNEFSFSDDESELGFSQHEQNQRLYELIANFSPYEDCSINSQATSGNQLQHHDQESREQRVNPIKSLDVAFEIIKNILVRDLERPPSQSQTYQILEEFPATESVFQYQVITWLLKHFQRNPKVNDGNAIQNLQKIMASMDRFLGEDPHVSLKAIVLINTLALKSSNKFREHLKSLKLIELRDKLLIEQVRKVYTHISRSQAEGIESKEVFINAICSLFSYGQLASKTIFASNFGVEYLTLVLLIITEQQEYLRPATSAKYSEYANQLKTRIKDEVLQFNQNDTSPELSAYFQGQGDAAFFSRLRDFLSQRVSNHMEDKRQAVLCVQTEISYLRNNLKKEKTMTERTQIQLSHEIQIKLQQDLNIIFEKAKNFIF